MRPKSYYLLVGLFVFLIVPEIVWAQTLPLVTTKGTGANTVYAVHDSQFRTPDEAPNNDRKSEALTKEDFKAMDTKAFMKLSDGKLNQYLKSNGFQEKYRAQNVKQLVEAGTVKPADLATYLEDANALLFNTPVTGAEVLLCCTDIGVCSGFRLYSAFWGALIGIGQRRKKF